LVNEKKQKLKRFKPPENRWAHPDNLVPGIKNQHLSCFARKKDNNKRLISLMKLCKKSSGGFNSWRNLLECNRQRSGVQAE
jgi:hypothetical protein